MFTKSIAAALAVTIGALSFASSAEADNRRHRHNHNNNDALAAGIFGFAAGAFVSSLAQPRYVYPQTNYYQPAPAYYQAPPVVYQPAPVYSARPAPWTPEWYAYCDSRYVSFNGQTGYFYGYDGQYHFCR